MVAKKRQTIRDGGTHEDFVHLEEPPLATHRQNLTRQLPDHFGQADFRPHPQCGDKSRGAQGPQRILPEDDARVPYRAEKAILQISFSPVGVDQASVNPHSHGVDREVASRQIPRQVFAKRHARFPAPVDVDLSPVGGHLDLAPDVALLQYGAHCPKTTPYGEDGQTCSAQYLGARRRRRAGREIQVAERLDGHATPMIAHCTAHEIQLVTSAEEHLEEAREMGIHSDDVHL